MGGIPDKAWVGQSRAAVDGPEIVTGELLYVTDMTLPQACVGMVKRAPVPHARLHRVDTSRAASISGVLAIVTARDVPVNALGAKEGDGPVLTTDHIRQFGEAIALVAAESEEVARTALDAITMDYEELTVLDTPERASMEDATQLFSSGNIAGQISFASGDVDEINGHADVIFSETVFTPSQEHVAIDTPGGLALLEGEDLTIWCGSQNPGLHQRKVARALDVDLESVRIIANPVGGAFGSRNDDPMPVYLALLARATNRPVRMRLTREETMIAGPKRHPFWTDATMGFDKDGRLLGSRITAVADTGPVLTGGPNVMKTSAEMSTGPYVIGAAEFKGTVVHTNNANSGAFRGYGVPQVAFAVENMMTLAADHFQMDPIEFRLRNILDGGQRHSLYKHRITEGLKVRETLEIAAQDDIWVSADEWKAAAEFPWLRGTGVATAIKGVGLGSGTGDRAQATLDVTTDGEILIWAGPNHTGQSIQTTYGQVAADALGVPIEAIDVRIGDTSSVPESGPTAASRSTYAGGGAVERVCREFLSTCQELELPLATDLRGTCEKLLQIGSGHFAAEFVLPEVDDPGLIPPELLSTFGPHRVYGACTQVIRVEMNRYTGEIRVPEILCVLDCGVAINPAATVGQAEGGILQGLGFAIMENHRLDGGRPLTTSLENYLIPTVTDTPTIRTVIVPGNESTGPYGAKGMSEVVVPPTGPAISAAVRDATGVLPRELPISGESLLALLEEDPC